MPTETPYRIFTLEGGGCSFRGGRRGSKSNHSWAEEELQETEGGPVHVVETVVTVFVKDINDNAPVFSNTTMFASVQENGPGDLPVVRISAWDADDASEGTNARLSYSIEKNVIEERSGEAIFAVEPHTGEVRTALCCLDRETTPEYTIQVVATDGGGLKGTGTVLVRLTDVNDNSPRLARPQWELKVPETWGAAPPPDDTILEITASDRDTANHFFYRVVEGSGWGWEHFGLRTAGGAGQLFARKTLDFEDETHRRGFRFMVQVTDRGPGGWHDPRHLDSAWVSVQLEDVNDNPPAFARPRAHVTVREDAAPGTLLDTLSAHDPDMGGLQQVDYRVEGGWDALSVGADGTVSLRRALDREAPSGGEGVAWVVAVDRGAPPLSATATLSITVTDVNDCAPRLLPPTRLHVREGAPPRLLGLLTATDDDVWALGHGPPFGLELAPSNPAYVQALLRLEYKPQADSGRGGAELYTVGALDREEHRQLAVGVVVRDAGGMSATQVVSIVVDDVNDNRMRPAAKTVYLWKTQGGGSDAPLGRVYVDDPDDWDVGDKTWAWLGSPHPLFGLSPETGDLFASSHVREGRYELQFSVSDRVWAQTGVRANVTVDVRLLIPDALAHAASVTLAPTTPADLTRGWAPGEGGGGLGRLVQAVQRVVGQDSYTVEVVSVYSSRDQDEAYYTAYTPTDADRSPKSSAQVAPRLDRIPHIPPLPSSPPFAAQHPRQDAADRTPASVTSKASPTPEFQGRRAPSTCVWVSARKGTASFMDPVKLQGLLAIHSQKLEKATGLRVVLEDASSAGEGLLAPKDTAPGSQDPSSAASLASTALPLQVVDTNSTALVTPRLSQAHTCQTPAHESEICTPTSCLNGGRCVRLQQGDR
ncbi:neural-cadherin-like [Penaeus chinensis]|uniref:neural-cadherin-like n=1 Tax=Penaeus chinensis TaxID=139456 RepID=UPI001FB8049C|nr:neural-cadherin-like [Penaeus chinensis]